MREFPSFSLISQPLVFSFGFGLAFVCRPLSGICSLPGQEGVKQQLPQAAHLLSWAGKREGSSQQAQLGCMGSACSGSCLQEVVLAWGRSYVLPGLVLGHGSISTAKMHRLPGKRGQWPMLGSSYVSHYAHLWAGASCPQPLTLMQPWRQLVDQLLGLQVCPVPPTCVGSVLPSVITELEGPHNNDLLPLWQSLAFFWSPSTVSC